MKSYRVIWEIDIEAESPEEAATEALSIQRNPEANATVFDIFDEEGNQTQIDLMEDEPEPYYEHGWQQTCSELYHDYGCAWLGRYEKCDCGALDKAEGKIPNEN